MSECNHCHVQLVYLEIKQGTIPAAKHILHRKLIANLKDNRVEFRL